MSRPLWMLICFTLSLAFTSAAVMGMLHDDGAVILLPAAAAMLMAAIGWRKTSETDRGA